MPDLYSKTTAKSFIAPLNLTEYRDPPTLKACINGSEGRYKSTLNDMGPYYHGTLLYSDKLPESWKDK